MNNFEIKMGKGACHMCQVKISNMASGEVSG